MSHRVVLCVIRPQDELPARLSHTDLFRFFSQFGVVKDVEIFNRKVLIKAFVEFGSHSEAEHALKVGHDQMTTFGRMQIFYSNKESIIKRTKSSALNIASLGNLADLQRSPKNNKLAFLSTLPTTTMPLRPVGGSIEETHQGGSFVHVSGPSHRPPTGAEINEFLLGDSRFNFDSNAGVVSGPLLATEGELGQAGDTKKMRVLMVNRINTKTVTVQHLFNLFGCYGNVNKVLINKESNYALVQFQTGAQALNACERLKNLDFFGSTLKVKVSRYTSLNFKTLEKEHNEKLCHLHGPSALFRFPTNSTESCESPSSSLKVSQVPLAMGLPLVQEWLGQYHEPEGLILLPNPADGTNTVLAEFGSVRRAVEVLCSLHAQKVNDKVVTISFSSSKEAFHP